MCGFQVDRARQASSMGKGNLGSPHLGSGLSRKGLEHCDLVQGTFCAGECARRCREERPSFQAGQPEPAGKKGKKLSVEHLERSRDWGRHL